MGKLNETKDIYMDTVLLNDEILLRKIKNVNSVQLSIVLSSYRKKTNLELTVNKIINQKFKDFEIIIVDDSIGNEIESVFELYSNHSNINYIKKQFGSKSVSKNIGLENAKGEYIIYLEGSIKDFSENYFVDMVRAIKENHSDIVVLVKNEYLNIYNEIFSKSKVVTGDYFITREIKNFYNKIDTCLASFIYRKQFLQVYDICFSKDLLEEENLYFKLLAFSKSKKVEILSSASYKEKNHINNSHDIISDSINNRRLNSIKLIENYALDKYNSDVLTLLVGYLYLELYKYTNSLKLKNDITKHIKNNINYFNIDKSYKKISISISIGFFVSMYIK